MCVGWVLSPVVGGVIAMAVYYVIRMSVLLRPRPGERAKALQPLFLTFTVAVCALFFLIKGPSVIKDLWKWAGLWFAVLLGLGIGMGVAAVVVCTAKAKAAAAGANGSEKKAIGHADLSAQLEKVAAVAKPASDALALRVAAADEVGEDNGASDEGETQPPPSTATVVDGSALAQKQHRPSQAVLKHVGRGGVRATKAVACGPSSSALKARGDRLASVAQDDESMQDDVEAATAEDTFKPLLVVSALSVAFAHGANDVGNAIGPLAVIYQVYNEGTIPANGVPDIPIWALVMGSVGFVVGIITLGSRTISTVGTKITTLTPTRSFATQIGAAIAVLASSVMGLPVSTSHCLVGAVIGIGLAQKLSGVTAPLSWGVLKRIALSWISTIPIAMVLALCFFYPFQYLFE